MHVCICEGVRAFVFIIVNRWASEEFFLFFCGGIGGILKG